MRVSFMLHVILSQVQITALSLAVTPVVQLAAQAAKLYATEYVSQFNRYTACREQSRTSLQVE